MKISTSNGVIFQLTQQEVDLCETLKDMLKDSGPAFDPETEVVALESIHSDHFQVLHELMTTKYKDLPSTAEDRKKLLEGEPIKEDQVTFYWQCHQYAAFLNSPYLAR